MSARFECDVCQEEMERGQRAPINFSGISDMCPRCQEIIKKTIDLIRVSPWGNKVDSVHKQIMKALNE